MKVKCIIALMIAAIYIETAYGKYIENPHELKTITQRLSSSDAKSSKNQCFTWCTRKSDEKYLLPPCGYYYKRNKPAYDECRICRRVELCLGAANYFSSRPKPDNSNTE